MDRCVKCGIPITQPRTGRRKYCSDKCRWRARKPRPKTRRTVWEHGRNVLRYRAVMERHLGRPLRPDEHVHHINEDPSDDRIENLRLLTEDEHQEIHRQQRVAARQALDEGFTHGPRKCLRAACANLVTDAVRDYCCAYCHRADSKGKPKRVRNTMPRAKFADVHPQCRICGAPGVHNHHVVYLQHVATAGAQRWDPDNALKLCVSCHMNGHTKLNIPIRVLRDENLAFAFRTLGDRAYDYLKRRYAGDDPRLDALLRG